ncbi:F-box/WD repeat-containing protein 2 [Heterocephalus glaber]|uniref:F-box/WD repeat-containing protein 2 n=1 Tax=Heterocephalus glaber TaxID=10181 RepID=G5B2U0_HETGA|nr:F-box/WD repeat-containing protein 2 [Heterocephalus glaber]
MGSHRGRREGRRKLRPRAGGDAGPQKVYLKAILRIKQLEDHEVFDSLLIGHSARVYALYYKDGLLCTGSDGLSAKLWDVSTGQCIYGIQTHTCTAVKFDEQKLVTGSFDNTVACWEWSSGARTQHFRGHTGAVFSVEYNDELDILWDFASYDILRVIKTPEIANLALLGFGDVFALLFDNRYLYIMDLWRESLISRWPLPESRKSKRGSSFLAGEASWLNGLDGHNDTGLVFPTSAPDHNIHRVLWKEHG